MPEKLHDGWAKADILARILITLLASILIPILIFYLGNRISEQQRVDNEKRRNLDRVTTLLKHLSSNDESEMVLAMKVCEHLVKEKQFPFEIAIHICDTASIHKNRNIQIAAIQLLDIIKSDKEYRVKLEKNINELRPQYKKIIITDVPQKIIEELKKTYLETGAEVKIFKRNDNIFDVSGTYKTIPGDIIRKFWKPDGANVEEINESKLRDWMMANNINTSLPFFIYSDEHKTKRIKAIKDLGLEK